MATGAAGDISAEVVKQWRARADELRGLLESMLGDEGLQPAKERPPEIGS